MILKGAKIAVLSDTKNIFNTARKYHLLPADALIALTCRRYSIEGDPNV